MPYTTEVIDNDRGILLVGNGVVTGGDLMASAKTVLGLVKSGRAPVYGLADLSGVTSFEASAREIEMNAAVYGEIQNLLPSIKVAIVAPGESIYGVARMWQIYMDQSAWDTQVFRTREEAVAWLGTERS